MRIAIRSRLARSVAISAMMIGGGAMRSAGAQALVVTDTTNRASRTDSATIPLTIVTPPNAPLPASNMEVAFASIGIGAAEGISGAFVGLSIDHKRCVSRHPRDRNDFFDFGDPCLGYATDATKIGWLAGSFAGATAGAVVMARVRGCPTRSAVLRASAGSMIGMLPAMITALTSPPRTPAPRSVLLGSAPILGGVGAALAVRDCHR